MTEVDEYFNKHRRWAVSFLEIWRNNLISNFIYIGKIKYENTPSKKNMK